MKEYDDSQVFPGTTQEDARLEDLGYEQGTHNTLLFVLRVQQSGNGDVVD